MVYVSFPLLMMTQVLLNLKGRKPQTLKEGEVYIGRKIAMGGWNLPASKWQNPFSIREYSSREIVLQKYEEYIRNDPLLMSQVEELRDKQLCCWCKPELCH